MTRVIYLLCLISLSLAQEIANIDEYIKTTPDIEDCITTNLNYVIPLYICKGGIVLSYNEKT